ncbi:hypothetical protein [Portibacter lacus]|uniref:Uncharacterized protein n=1 Tax=Portibacter lacus TaxID=1099794 RepID=A0AA37WHQ9_9BACT|nr:hypothetical protein [Portibacter lacus]GLR19754.1 hypothetical protein GCM10007940_43700 [Portibacter lacus]
MKKFIYFFMYFGFGLLIVSCQKEETIDESIKDFFIEYDFNFGIANIISATDKQISRAQDINSSIYSQNNVYDAMFQEVIVSKSSQILETDVSGTINFIEDHMNLNKENFKYWTGGKVQMSEQQNILFNEISNFLLSMPSKSEVDLKLFTIYVKYNASFEKEGLRQVLSIARASYLQASLEFQDYVNSFEGSNSESSNRSYNSCMRDNVVGGIVTGAVGGGISACIFSGCTGAAPAALVGGVVGGVLGSIWGAITC